MRTNRVPAWTMVAIVLALAAATGIRADDCPDHGPTVAALRHCVEHAFQQGHVTSGGVATSLLAKLEAAQAALERGQLEAALGLLHAFVYEVQAQAGQHIEPPHDQHLIMHAEAVIAALG